MTKTVDFTKKIVCSDDTIKVVQVIPVNYENENFKHLIVYEMENGYQDTCEVNIYGTPSEDALVWRDDRTFLNPEPEVVSSFYRNVYNQGVGDMTWSSREDADWDCCTSSTQIGRAHV